MARWSERPRQDRNPNVAPFESCVVCYRGDTTTTYAVRGEAEFLVASLTRAGLPEDEATGLVELVAHDHYGCDPGKVPVGDMEILVRLCPDCAATSGFKVGPVGHTPLYDQDMMGLRE